MHRRVLLTMLAIIAGMVFIQVAQAAPSRILYEPKGTSALGDIRPSDATFRLTPQGLEIHTGHTKPWPGLTLRTQGDPWDLSAYLYLCADIENVGDQAVTVNVRVDNPGANGRDHCITGNARIAPGRTETVIVRFHPTPWVLSEPLELIGMRGYPQVRGKLDPSNVVGLVIFVGRPKQDHAFRVRRIYTAGSARVLDAKTFIPFIDRFGQFAHADWPGKVHAEADLDEHLKAERDDHAAHPGPKDWDKYGGWLDGPKLKATGFFRTEKIRGKWWLVDPDGRLFWSHGIDCVHEFAATPITDREHYFQWLPDDDSPFAEFYGRASWAPHGYYKDHSPYRTFDFARANILRKYGPQWPHRFARMTHRRLRSWGLNTIGNWSSTKIAAMHRTPYVGTIHFSAPVIEGSTGYWGKFYDVFDPAFRDAARKAVRDAADRGIGDPWCIGFFVHNELAWGDDTSLAVAALQSPPDQPAKHAFIDDLKHKYRTIDALNRAWGSNYASWDQMLQRTDEPDKTRAAEDLGTFYTRIAETYFSIIRDALKHSAPNQLYLGCRFAWVNDRAARAAAKYCDVIGHNRYAYTVADMAPPAGVDKPIIIGEFHFGALDRGMFHTGLRPTLDQNDRAAKYTAYVRGALRNPHIVGTHWFQYKDQATTGRGDGENYQIGFVDIADTPYPETIAAARDVGYSMYAYRFENESKNP